MKKLILMALILMGCAGSPPLVNTDTHRIIRVETIVHVVLSQDQFDDKILKENKTLLGYTIVPGGPIWIVGRLESGKLVVPEKVLGHEVIHLMAEKDKSIKGPDIGKTKWVYKK